MSLPALAISRRPTPNLAYATPPVTASTANAIMMPATVLPLDFTPSLLLPPPSPASPLPPEGGPKGSPPFPVPGGTAPNLPFAVPLLPTASTERAGVASGMDGVEEGEDVEDVEDVEADVVAVVMLVDVVVVNVRVGGRFSLT